MTIVGRCSIFLCLLNEVKFKGLNFVGDFSSKLIIFSEDLMLKKGVRAFYLFGIKSSKPILI